MDFNDSPWLASKKIFNRAPKSVFGPFGTTNGWMPVPSQIPPMEMKDERPQKVVNLVGDVKIPDGFPQKAISIPANSTNGDSGAIGRAISFQIICRKTATS